MVISIWSIVEKGTSGIPNCLANASVLAELATARIVSPSEIRCAIFCVAQNAVDPVPSPTIIPSSTNSTAFSAATCLGFIDSPPFVLSPYHNPIMMALRHPERELGPSACLFGTIWA
ncbi:hypothetical protein D3C71_1607910 [compost metagenome]